MILSVLGVYEYPYKEYPDIKMDFQVAIRVAEKGLRPSIPPSCPPVFAKLIQSCVDAVAEKRPSAAQVNIQHLLLP
jgi:hypothetical protein